MSTLTHWVYWSWIPVFLVHLILNGYIYLSIGKEEFEYYGTNTNMKDDMLLSIFTFKWSKAFQEDDSKWTTRLMKISNVFSIIFILHTTAVFFLWVFTYGK